MSIDAKKCVASGWSEPVPVKYTTKELILYALGTGSSDLQFIYENHDDFAPLPWFPIVLPFKGDAIDVVGFPSETMGALSGHAEGQPAPAGPVLDGERELQLLNPLPPAGTPLLCKGRIVGLHNKGSGALLESETLIEDAAGKQYIRIISGAFYVGVTDFESAGVTYSKKIKAPNRAPDKSVEQKTSVQQAHLYRLSGDYNPLHIDPEMAQVFGFKAPILHGLCSFGHSARHILAAYANNDVTRFKAIKVRFSKPVLPGQTLVTNMWHEHDRILFETVVKETGKVCMSSGYMQLAGPCLRQSKL